MGLTRLDLGIGSSTRSNGDAALPPVSAPGAGMGGGSKRLQVSGIGYDRRRMVGSSLGGVPREQKMLKGHLPRVMYYQVYLHTKINTRNSEP